MEDQLEARISSLEFHQSKIEARIEVLEHNQEEFGYEMYELKKLVIKLMEKGGHKNPLTRGVALQQEPAFVNARQPRPIDEVASGSGQIEKVDKLEKGMEEMTRVMTELKGCVETYRKSQSQNDNPQGKVLPYPPPSTLCPPNTIPHLPRSRPYHQLNFQAYPIPHTPHPYYAAHQGASRPGLPVPSIQPVVIPPPIPPAKPLKTCERKNPPRVKFDPIPMTYTDLLPQLLERRMIALITTNQQFEPPYPTWYDANATCAYHSGAKGHTTESCFRLKEKVQALIKEGRLGFQKNGTLNEFEPVI